jgi:hypothetical protein
MIYAFSWEPKGSRFGVLHGDQARPHVSFFGMKKGKCKDMGTFCPLAWPRCLSFHLSSVCFRSIGDVFTITVCLTSVLKTVIQP